uniref:centrosomal protein of 55 kDa-like n=1 Tax=Semicossyphus pulcher TaxID=241346 RepID=UPI0037E967C5
MTQRHETHQSARVIEMVPSKYKRSPRKKLNSELEVLVSSLGKENAYLKETLVESRHHYSALNKLLERFLTLETLRLENCQQQKTKDKNISLQSEQLSNAEDQKMDGVSVRSQRIISSYSREMEEIKTKLVSISTRCQHLENKVARKKALEKNKQWLEYDQQREAYVRAILARMLWLEKQLNEANKARSQQHKEDHSDEKEQISHMQEHHERLLLKAKEELEVLRNQLDRTHQNWIRTQSRCKEREEEVEELRQQLQTEKMSRENVLEDHCCSDEEEQQLSEETGDLRRKLDEERRKSIKSEIMAGVRERLLINVHHADRRTIKDLQRQMKISSQDLEDERQDCSYLKKQLVSVRKMLQNTKDLMTKLSKRDQQNRSSCEAAPPPSPPSRDCLQSSPHSSLQNESILECPICQTQYPASHYRELIHHLEMCQD